MNNPLLHQTQSQSRLLFQLPLKSLSLALLFATFFSGSTASSASARDTVLLWPENPELNAPENMGVSKERGGKTRVTQVGTPHLNVYPAYLAHRKTGELAPWIDIPEDTPPTLIISARDDTKHFPNSPVYEKALKEAGVPVRAHYFDEGGHGFGLRDTPPTADWPEMYLEWLKHIQIVR